MASLVCVRHLIHSALFHKHDNYTGVHVTLRSLQRLIQIQPSGMHFNGLGTKSDSPRLKELALKFSAKKSRKYHLMHSWLNTLWPILSCIKSGCPRPTRFLIKELWAEWQNSMTTKKALVWRYDMLKVLPKVAGPFSIISYIQNCGITHVCNVGRIACLVRSVTLKIVPRITFHILQQVWVLRKKKLQISTDRILDSKDNWNVKLTIKAKHAVWLNTCMEKVCHLLGIFIRRHT